MKRSPIVLQHMPPREAWKDGFVNLLLFLYPFSFSLDFKGDQSGTIWQVLMAIVAIAIFLALCIFGSLSPTRNSVTAILWTGVTILGGLIVAQILDVPFEQTIRTVLPYGLFFTGLWAGSIAANSIKAAWALYSGMALAATVSLVYRYYYSTRVAGLELAEMRYQVLTPVVSTLIAFICVSFCYVKRIRITAILISGAVTVVVALSITRTFILTLVALVFGLGYLLWRLTRNNPLHQQYSSSRRIGLIVVFCGVFAGLFLAYFLRPDMFDSWADRVYLNRVLTRSGDDVNLVTRLAEAKGIYGLVSESPWSLIFGKGFGNTYQWSWEYSEEVRSVSPQMLHAFFAPLWTAGHSPFNYALLFGGIPAVLWQFWIFLNPLIKGLAELSWFRRVTDSRLLQIYLFNLLSLILYLSQCLTMNPFAERMTAHLLGLSIGMSLAVSKLQMELVTRKQADRAN